MPLLFRFFPPHGNLCLSFRPARPPCGRSHMPCPSCPAFLILRRPGCKLRLLLLKRRCKEPHIFIDRPDSLHFLSCQFKIKDIKIIPDMLRIGGFRKNDRALLDMPAQDDLNIGFPWATAFSQSFHAPYNRPPAGAAKAGQYSQCPDAPASCRCPPWSCLPHTHWATA